MEDTTYALNKPYVATAVYYEDADLVEYVRRDVPCVYHRVDTFLTLALEMETRGPIGFRLKGFKNFYLRHIANEAELDHRERFLALVKVIEIATRVLGNKLFEADRRAAYDEAIRIAKEDNAALRDLPVAV